MNTLAPSQVRSEIHAVPAQHADQTFPTVLVAGTGGAVLTLGSILLTAIALA